MHELQAWLLINMLISPSHGEGQIARIIFAGGVGIPSMIVGIWREAAVVVTADVPLTDLTHVPKSPLGLLSTDFSDGLKVLRAATLCREV